jgi:hypothetical protein
LLICFPCKKEGKASQSQEGCGVIRISIPVALGDFFFFRKPKFGKKESSCNKERCFQLLRLKGNGKNSWSLKGVLQRLCMGCMNQSSSWLLTRTTWGNFPKEAKRQMYLLPRVQILASLLL